MKKLKNFSIHTLIRVDMWAAFERKKCLSMKFSSQSPTTAACYRITQLFSCEAKKFVLSGSLLVLIFRNLLLLNFFWSWMLLLLLFLTCRWFFYCICPVVVIVAPSCLRWNFMLAECTAIPDVSMYTISIQIYKRIYKPAWTLCMYVA